MFKATLKHGDLYRLASVDYKRGVPVTVDAATKSHLETYAVESVLLPGGELHVVQKFEFSPVGAHSVSAPTVVSAPSDSDDAEDEAPAAPVVSGRPKAR